MRLSFAVYGCLLVALPGFAQGQESKPAQKAAETKPDPAKPDSAKPASRADQLKAITKQHGGKAEKLQEEIDDLQTKLDDLKGKQKDLAAEQIGKLMELIKADPKDGVSRSAIDILLREQLDHLDKEQGTLLFETLTQHHAESDKITAICEYVAELDCTDAIQAFLNAVVAKNKNAEARAWATYGLAVAAYTNADFATSTTDADPKLFKEAEQLFAKVVKEIPPDETEGTPVDAAERYLFELRNLLPGKKAPDFESTDLKGKPVKFSQLKGKVTLLVFWATWDQFSTQFQPQQQELAKKYKGRPLTLVGISGDDDVETLNDYLKEHPLPWTQWFNGPEGGVLDDWNVQSFPTIYLIDAAGVIRHRNLYDDKLDEAVETLVKEAEDAKKKSEKDPPKPPK